MKSPLTILILSSFLLASNCKSLYKKFTYKEGIETPTLDNLECVEDRNKNFSTLQCFFPEFSISVSNLPQMQNKKFVLDFYNYFMKNAFYGHEINSLSLIHFNGSKENGNLLGSYSPVKKIISLFPNSSATSSIYSDEFDNVKKIFLNKKDYIKSYQFWSYLALHEYSHHFTFVYGSNGKLTKFSSGGQTFYDYGLNQKATDSLKMSEITKRKEFKDFNLIAPIVKDSAFPNIGYPTQTIYTTQNKYYWSKTELLSRHFLLYTYPMLKELEKGKSTIWQRMAWNDYWWMAFYNINMYEKNKDKKTQQELINKWLKKFATHTDDEFINDDAKYGAIFNDYNDDIYITSHNKFFLRNDLNKEKIKFIKLPKKTNTFYNKKAYDSRQKNEIKIESNVYKSKMPLPIGKWTLYSSFGKKVKDAFNLENGEKKYLLSNQDAIIYAQKTSDEIIIVKSLIT